MTFTTLQLNDITLDPLDCWSDPHNRDECSVNRTFVRLPDKLIMIAINIYKVSEVILNQKYILFFLF